MSVFMQPIYTQTASGSSTTFQFNNIPQGFTDLKIMISGRTQSASNYDSFWIRTGNGSPNGGFVYSNLRMVGTGNSSFSDTSNSDASPFIAISANVATSTYLANTFSSYEIYIPNYSRGSIKTALIQNAVENNNLSTNVYLMQYAQTIYDTSPINTVQIATASGSNWTAGTTVTLYGISNVYDTAAPTAPTIGTVTDQAGFASVAFTPAANDQADLYAVTSTPSSSTTYGTGTPIVTPAILGTSYTYKVSSVNSLGSIESASSSSLTTSNSYSSIASYVFPSNSLGTIMFSGIPQNYKHLQLRIIARSTRTYSGNALDVMSMRINGDYQTASHYLYGNGAGGSVGSNYQPGWNAGLIVSASSGTLATNANVFSPVVIDIYNYSNTSMYKTARSTFGIETNLAYADAGVEGIGGTMFPQLTPVQTIQIDCSNANFAQNTIVALYGIGG